jgi:chromosome transmission fidelity protein 1
MHALYSALDAGGLALFESPTGTGKTLSLVVGALTWLRDKRAAQAADEAASRAAAAASAVDDGGLPPWLAAAAADREADAAAVADERRRARLARARARRDARLEEGGRGRGANAAAAKAGPPPRRPPTLAPDADFIIADDDGDDGALLKRALSSSSDGASSSDSDSGRGVVDRPGAAGVRVIVTSRTHTQLAQFVGELRRTPFGDEFASVSLASRAALCVNDAVLAARTPARISEACLDLQSARGKAAAAKAARAAGGDADAAKAARRGCPFRAPPGSARRRLRDALLATPHDVEEAAAAGRAGCVCPYYASRAAAADADVVFLPYSALLSPDARDSLGVDLERSIVIVDEAHNLPGAVAGAASATLSRRGAAVAEGALAHYLATYGARLGPATRRDVQTLLAMCRGLAKAAGWSAGGAAASAPAVKPRALTLDAFAAASGLDNVNAFRLVESLKERKAIPKVAGAAAAAAAAGRPLAGAAGVVTPAPRASAAAPADDGEADPTPVAALHALSAFVLALTTADADGRVVADASSLRFVLLNAGARFGAVLARARAVVLASGTLEPTRSLEAQLFPDPAVTRAAHRFACGHVLPPDRLLALAVGTGPTGVPLDLRARGGARDAPATLDEIGRLLTNVCAAVPGGVVAFFPSFAALATAQARWAATGAAAGLARRKRVFTEPRGAAAAAAVLAAFSEAALDASSTGGGGALLLCVIGAKLSEGINFGDGLGRCVLVFGVPYPPPDDAELTERMRFLDAAVAPGAGRALYDDTAAVAVNQAVGRAVRHARDWAAVMLVDARYAAPPSSSSRPPPTAKLPGWMKPSLRVVGGYGEAHAALAAFCRRMEKEG